MKKLTAIILAALMLLTLASCAGKNATDTDGATPADAVSVNDVKLMINHIKDVAEKGELSVYTDWSDVAKDVDSVNAYIDKADEEEKATLLADGYKEASEKVLAWYENVNACMEAYQQAFCELNPGASITAVGCITEIIEGEAYVFPALTAVVNGSTVNRYSTSRYTDASIGSLMSNSPDLFFTDTPINEERNALVKGNTTLMPAVTTGQATASDAK